MSTEKSKRLTEEDVYTAAEEIKEAGEKLTANNLLKKLERGSLTTITKHLNSFNDNDITQYEANIEIPETIELKTKTLIRTIWLSSVKLANDDLKNEKEKLETLTIEAKEFSETQNTTIESLRENQKESEAKYQQEIQELKNSINGYKEELEKEKSKYSQLENKNYELVGELRVYKEFNEKSAGEAAKDKEELDEKSE